MDVTAMKHWAIILAGGVGTRLRPLTRLTCRSDLPKQYVPMLRGRSLLEVTLSRVAPYFPADRTIVVVGESHQEVAAQQLRAYEGVEVVGQPENRGTAPGILLPLARIRSRDPNSNVAIFPSDHYVPRPHPLLEAVERAFDSVPGRDVTVLGVEPDGPETEYGWILPDRSVPWNVPDCWSVQRFVEKPAHSVAENLLEQGALWNTFITVGRLAAIWEMTRSHLPRLTRLFDAYVEAVGQPDESHTLKHIYSQMTPADFSRGVLERASGLAVMRVQNSGWSDWGTPERVFKALGGIPELVRIMERRDTQRMPIAPTALDVRATHAR